MILGIIGAMSEELEILLKDMSLEDVQIKANMKFHKGKLWGEIRRHRHRLQRAHEACALRCLSLYSRI